MSIEDHEFVLRDYRHLEEFLYEGPNTTRADRLSMKRFDRIDIVYILGDPRVVPWANKFEQVRFLFKMLKMTKKRCLLIQCGFSLLSYFCATGLAELQVVNGKEKGTNLDYIKNAAIIERTSKYKDNVFLDNNSGDYYQYNLELKKWLPQGNVGLHLKRCTVPNPAAEAEVACSKKPTFRAMESKHAYGVYL